MTTCKSSYETEKYIAADGGRIDALICLTVHLNAEIGHLFQSSTNHAARLQVVQESGVDDVRVRCKIVPSSTICD